MLEQVAPYWPAAAGIAGLVAIIAAVGRGILVVSRHMRGRTLKRRTRRIVDTVTPMLDERFLVVDAAMLNLQIELGDTSRVVNEVKAIVSDGLQDDVAYLRDRVDGIAEHLMGD